MTHAMVISGVHLDAAGKPVRYKVENSWGETAGKEGYFVMTDAWFDESVSSTTIYWTLLKLTSHRYVYQVVVPKALAPRDLVAVYEAGEKIVLPAWDPMVRIHTFRTLFFWS